MDLKKLKEFFKKKKTEVKFSRAGPGHSLNEQREIPSRTVKQETVVSHRGERINNSTNQQQQQQTSSGASSSAGEAALKRFQANQQQTSIKKTSHLDNIRYEEKRKIQEQMKAEAEASALEKRKPGLSQSKTEKNNVMEEDRQLYTCPDVELTEPFSLDTIRKKIQEKISLTFNDNELVMYALMVINCNDEAKANTCMSTIELILSNLLTDNLDEREKFRKIKKAKIERRILDIQGGMELFTLLGFALDSDGEWYICQIPDDQVKEEVEYFHDIITNCKRFPVELHRNPIVRSSLPSDLPQNSETEFFEVSASEVAAEQKILSARRETAETLMTKAMRDELNRIEKPDYKYTRLRFILGSDKILEATFKREENLVDVCNWLIVSSFIEPSNFSLVHGTKTISETVYSKTLHELELTPAATLIIKF